MSEAAGGERGMAPEELVADRLVSSVGDGSAELDGGVICEGVLLFCFGAAMAEVSMLDCCSLSMSLQ